MKFVAPDWPAPAGVHAVTTLRAGGVSATPFDSLNLAQHVGDAPECVQENRRRLRSVLELEAEPYWLNQVHGTTVVPVSVQAAGPLEADAAIANQAGIACAILTADCLPVLFASRDGRRVAAAHAGWRGLAAGVLEATVSRLAVPPSELIAWLGPAIGPEHFEVGAEVREAFTRTDPAVADAFVDNARGRWFADLDRLARRRLERAGIRSVYGGGRCTFRERTAFFSYRRDGQCGRVATLIWMS